MSFGPERGPGLSWGPSESAEKHERTPDTDRPEPPDDASADVQELWELTLEHADALAEAREHEPVAAMYGNAAVPEHAVRDEADVEVELDPTKLIPPEREQVAELQRQITEASRAWAQEHVFAAGERWKVGHIRDLVKHIIDQFGSNIQETMTRIFADRKKFPSVPYIAMVEGGNGIPDIFLLGWRGRGEYKGRKSEGYTAEAPDETELHDHGASAAAVGVVSGRVKHTLYRFARPDKAMWRKYNNEVKQRVRESSETRSFSGIDDLTDTGLELPIRDIERAGPGQVIPLSPGEMHLVEREEHVPEGEIALSLHAYQEPGTVRGPGLGYMTSFRLHTDQESGRRIYRPTSVWVKGVE